MFYRRLGRHSAPPSGADSEPRYPERVPLVGLSPVSLSCCRSANQSSQIYKLCISICNVPATARRCSSKNCCFYRHVIQNHAMQSDEIGYLALLSILCVIAPARDFWRHFQMQSFAATNHTVSKGGCQFRPELLPEEAIVSASPPAPAPSALCPSPTKAAG